MRTVARRSPNRVRGGVLQVVLNLAPGGTERLVVETVRRLHHRFRMAVCCLDDDGPWAEELRQEGVEVMTLRRRPGFQPSLGQDIARMAARHGAGVLHCHHYSPFVYGCIARTLSPRLRLLFTEHGRAHDGPPSRKRRLANVFLARMPDRVCVVSADLQRHMATEGFHSGVEVVPNGIEPGGVPDEDARLQARQLMGVDRGAFLIGSVGRLDPVKDFPTLIAAFRQVALSRPNARLVIVGDGPVRGELERQAAGAPEIRFMGHRADVRSLLAGFDAYASSSIFEGVSLTILEAMAAARPVAATRVGGTPEVVVDGGTGVLVEPRDAAALAQALLRLSADLNQAQAMGTAGRARVFERFTLDRMVNYYAAAYSQLGAS